ncbi:hypothetical protein [Corynebacterium guaraldiae]|uniref:hypothetical protein n=1 Tax=Corynebacterium guaraldiae TaxID=3051103 RepID=UPI0011789FE6|nr:hypothetical protein [Corynebacterium guaraldiae]TRX43761.1 hypothetical protein FNY89_01260 [Corynebacterium guaraldiae]
MTSPFTKPGATQDKYQDVYSKGGTYGSDLRTEDDVRRLLKTEIRSPFAKAVQDVVNAVEGVVSDIASAIRGEGARYEVINVAVTERLGPINTLITQTGARHKELADKVDRSIEKQAGINQEQAKTIKEAGDAVQALKDYKAEVQAKVQSSIDTAKSATSEAAALRSELTKLSNGLDARIEQSKAAKDLQNKFDKLNNEFGSRVDSAISNSPKLKELSAQAKAAMSASDATQKKAESAISKADSATDDAKKALFLQENSVNIGSSIVPVIPGTTTPTWQDGLVEVKKGAYPEDSSLPDRIKTYYRHAPEQLNSNNRDWSHDTREMSRSLVSVDNRYEYYASFWIRTTGGNPQYIMITLCDETGNRHIVAKAPSTDLQTGRSDNTWGNPVRAIIARPTTEWQFVETVFVFREGVEFSRIQQVHFQANSGTEPLSMFLADLRIGPLIPSQADVDRAQNKAIEANKTAIAANNEAIKANKATIKNANETAEAAKKASEANTLALKNQKKINEESARWKVETEDWKAKKDQFEKTTKDFLKTQAAVEKLQTKTDTAQNDALTALNKPEMADSLVPMVPNNGRISGVGKYDWIPEYATFDSSATAFSGGVYLQSATQSQTAIRGVPVKVEPGGTYKVEFTAAAGVSGSVMYLELRDSNGKSHAIESSTYFTVKGDSTKYGDGGRYVISNLELKRGTWTYTGYITIRKDVEYAQLWNLYWNHPRSTATGTQRLESLKIYRHVPSQAEIDELQNKAIEQSEKFQIEQERINRLVQEQLWNHQDTMEFLDIRAPKTYGYNIAGGKGTSWTKTTIPYKSYSGSSGSYNASGYYNKEVSPFVTVLTEQGDKTAWVVCKGKWEGSFNISLNWTNGAVDNWSIDLKSTGARVFQFTGGAATIHLRQITVTVFANCLNREMTMKLASFNKVGDAGTLKGDTSLFRGVVKTDRPNSFRLKAPVSCDRNLDYLDENGNWKTLSAGTTFSGKTVALPSSTRTLSFYEKWEYGGEWDKPSGNDWDSHNGNTSVDKFQAN